MKLWLITRFKFSSMLAVQAKHPAQLWPPIASIISIQWTLRCSPWWQWQSVALWVVYNVSVSRCGTGLISTCVAFVHCPVALCVCVCVWVGACVGSPPWTRIRTNSNPVAVFRWVPPGDLLKSAACWRCGGITSEWSSSRSVVCRDLVFIVAPPTAAAAVALQHLLVRLSRAVSIVFHSTNACESSAMGPKAKSGSIRSTMKRHLLCIFQVNLW